MCDENLYSTLRLFHTHNSHNNSALEYLAIKRASNKPLNIIQRFKFFTYSNTCRLNSGFTWASISVTCLSAALSFSPCSRSRWTPWARGRLGPCWPPWVARKSGGTENPWWRKRGHHPQRPPAAPPPGSGTPRWRWQERRAPAGWKVTRRRVRTTRSPMFLIKRRLIPHALCSHKSSI